MYYYALSLSHAQFLMVNSSWTRGHIASIISHEHFGPAIRWAHRMTPLLFIKLFLSPSVRVMCGSDRQGSGNCNKTHEVKPVIVYPPCDTRELAEFPLQGRERIILSVAQFRCVDYCIRTDPPCWNVDLGQRRIFRHSSMHLHNF